MKDKKDVKYYNNEFDPMWKIEVEKLIPWFSGKGADVGSGRRSFDSKIIRVDIDKKVKPDILASGDALPFKDNELDFICSIHSFEHFEDQKKTLVEWLRVIKPGGIIGIVHPDIDHTKKQNPVIDAPGLKLNPYNKHWHENNASSFEDQLELWSDLRFSIIDRGVACPNWSFYFIIRKN